MMQLLLAASMVMDTGRAKMAAGMNSDAVLGQSFMAMREIIKLFLRFGDDACAEFQLIEPQALQYLRNDWFWW